MTFSSNICLNIQQADPIEMFWSDTESNVYLSFSSSVGTVGGAIVKCNPEVASAEPRVEGWKKAAPRLRFLAQFNQWRWFSNIIA